MVLVLREFSSRELGENRVMMRCGAERGGV